MATRLSRCFVGAAAAAAAAATAAAGGTARKSDSGDSSSNSSKGSNRNRQNGLRREQYIDTFVDRSSGATNSYLCSRGFSGAATGSLEAERSPSSWRELFGSAVLLMKVAHADALAAGEEMKEGAVISQLEEGEKPELIQRADEQAEKMKSQVRRPSPFPDQFQEVAHLTNVHSFEGFRVDVAKAITPTFFSQQSIFFGSPQFPKGHYQGNLTVVGDGDTTVRASMDADYNANMDAGFSLGLPGLIGKLNIQQGKNEIIQGTAVYMGETWAGQVSAGSGPLEVSYNQAVTANLTVGGQGQFSEAQQAAGLLYGFKYSTAGWTILGRYIGGANVITAQYVRKVVPGRVSLAAEYQAQLGTGSQMSVGAEFSLRQSKISASLDSNGKVDSSLEVRLGTFPTLPMSLTLCSSLDHVEDKHTFGLALTCGQ